MDGRQQDDALTDDRLDREVQALFAIEPSPEFTARVRAAVAGEPAATAWFGWPRLAVASGVFAAAALLVGVTWGVMRVGHGAPGGVREAVVTPPAAVSPSGPTARVQPLPVPIARPAPRAMAKGRAVRRDSEAAADAAFPEVLIAEDERRAFRMLVEEFERRRRMDAVELAAEPEVPFIALTPIEIPPLPPFERLEGEGE